MNLDLTRTTQNSLGSQQTYTQTSIRLTERENSELIRMGEEIAEITGKNKVSRSDIIRVAITVSANSSDSVLARTQREIFERRKTQLKESATSARLTPTDLRKLEALRSRMKNFGNKKHRISDAIKLAIYVLDKANETSLRKYCGVL